MQYNAQFDNSLYIKSLPLNNILILYMINEDPIYSIYNITCKMMAL